MSWLCKECVVCDESISKNDPLVNCSTEAQEVIYKTDHILANHGHTVVWLPLFMCDPSHIELVWPKIKRLGHEGNIIINVNLLKLQVTNASASLVTKDDWKEFCIPVDIVDEQDRQCMYNTEACSHNLCCCGKAINIKYYECVCSWPSYPACKSHIFYVVLSYVACLALPYFSTISYKQHVKCVLIFPRNLSKTFLIMGKIQRDSVINVHSSSWKVPNMLVRF